MDHRPGVRGFLLILLASGALARPGEAQNGPRVWQVDSRPSALIGTDFGDESYLFESVVSAVFLGRNRIAVADGGYHVVRVYDTAGRFLHAMGRRGGGPGEFQSIYGMWRGTDGLLGVWDPGSRRISRFDPAGSLVSTALLEQGGIGNLEVFFGALPDNSVLLGALVAGPRRSGEQVWDPWLVERYDKEGRYLGRVRATRGMWRWDGNPVPYSPMPWAATVGELFLVADGYDAVVEVTGLDGRLVRTIDVVAVPAATHADWRTLRSDLDELKERHPAARLSAELIDRGEVPFDARVPSVAGMLVDSEGLVWVKAYDPRRDSILLRFRSTRPAPGGRWYVYDIATGTHVAVADMPANLIPLDVDAGRVLGLTVDAAGVERIAVVRLRRQVGRQE